jgi:hypothetical protein
MINAKKEIKMKTFLFNNCHMEDDYDVMGVVITEKGEYLTIVKTYFVPSTGMLLINAFEHNDVLFG